MPNSLEGSLQHRSNVSPRPPKEPHKSSSESINKVRQHRRHRHMSSDASRKKREIRSADNGVQDKQITQKIKIYSAPSPRSKTISDKSTNLYVFVSLPELSPQDKSQLPKKNRKSDSYGALTTPLTTITASDNIITPCLTINTNIKPFKSEASPVISNEPVSNWRRVSRQSLQQINIEKFIQKARKSLPELQRLLSSAECSNQFLQPDNQASITLSENDFGNNPLDLKRYKSPDNVSESFEDKMLKSLTAQCTSKDEAVIPVLLCNIFNSKEFIQCKSKITPRTKHAIGSSYSDEDSHMTTSCCPGKDCNAAVGTTCTLNTSNNLGKNFINKLGTCANYNCQYNNVLVTNQNSGRSYDFHNEWKRHPVCSQDTLCSTDVITESSSSSGGGFNNTSGLTSRKSTNITNQTSLSSSLSEYVSVFYIQEFDCYYNAETALRKTKKADPETNLGPAKNDNEDITAIAHIYGGKNNTFITVTDMTGAECFFRVSGGQEVKAGRDKNSAYAALNAATKAAARVKNLGITSVYIRIRGDGGNRSKICSQSATVAIRALARAGMRVGRLEDVTPIPHDHTRRKGGRRGRRL